MACGLVWLQERRAKTHVFRRDWITYSNYDSHSMFNNQHIHNIPQRRGLSEYNNEMLGAQSEYESPYATLRASESYNTRAHKT